MTLESIGFINKFMLKVLQPFVHMFQAICYDSHVWVLRNDTGCHCVIHLFLDPFPVAIMFQFYSLRTCFVKSYPYR